MLLVTGLVAGVAVGLALRKGDLCFHSAIRGGGSLAKAWVLAVAVGAVGLTAVYGSGAWPQLSRGLAFRPVHNVVGGLVFGLGMVVAASCASGLFYKLGAGMVGACVGILAFFVGEMAAATVRVPGPTVIRGGTDATLPGLLGLPRWTVALPLAALAVLLLLRTSREGRWIATGLLLAAALVASWVLAGVGGHSFGASTVGVGGGIRAGSAPLWLIGFLGGIVAGSFAASLATGRFRVRGETSLRYGQLLAGGFLLGLGARVAGGCNLGHGLSGVAQLGISSFVTVAGMVGGVLVAASVRRRLADPLPNWRAERAA